MPLCFRLFFSLLFVQLFLAGCGPDARTSRENEQTDKIMDSLRASGTHGFYERIFIVGRIKTMEISAAQAAFNVTVLNMDEPLQEQQIRVRVVDAQQCILQYTHNDSIISRTVPFDSVYVVPGMKLRLEQTDVLKQLLKISQGQQAETVQYAFAAYKY